MKKARVASQRKNNAPSMEINRTLTILQHNVQNWHANKFSLSNIYKEIDPDVILINAHGIKTGETISIHNYNIYKKNSLNEAHAGAAIAIKRTLSYRINESFYTDLLAVQINTQLGPIEIATSYIPPRTGYLHYPDYHSLFKSTNPVYFLGDINARHPGLGNNSENIVGKQIMTLIGRNHITHEGPYFPTFINYRSKTSPDIILTNKKVYHNIIAIPGSITPSDHTPIICKISTSPIMIKIAPRLSYKKANWDKYKEELEKVTINNLDNATKHNIDKLTNDITEQIQKASKIAIPQTQYRVAPHFHTTEQIKQLQREHNNLLMVINNTAPSLTLSRRLKHLRAQLREEYLRLREKMWDELIEKVDTERNDKDFWLSIKRMMGGNSRTEQRYLKNSNGEDIYEEEGKEQLFRNYWQNVFKISEEENESFDKAIEEEVKQCLEENKLQIETLEISNTERRNEDIELVTEREIRNLIKTFKQRAPGSDGITKYHLDHLPLNIIRNLANIYNTGLKIGYFPSMWKISQMIFIPKPGKTPLQHINYRPISLLNILGKLFEKIINNRLTTSLQNLNLTNCRQHGFTKGKGTDTATAVLYEIIAVAKANKSRINLVLRDISKAFDKVWHQGLIYKLIKGNIPNYLIRIVNNYLTGRKAQIKIDSYIGPTFELLSGVPQGGCLSPSLFNFYTHDLPPPTGNSEQVIYADDITQIIINHGGENMLAQLTKRAIETINKFENKWKIQTNINKFQIIPIGRKIAKDITINNKTFRTHNEGKVLGTEITTKGFFKHATTRIKQAKHCLPKLFRFRNLSRKNKRKIYQAMIKSALEYPPVPLHTISKNQQKKMQVIQNKAARIITKTRLREGKTNEYINKRANLEPLNISIHNRAVKIWNKLEDNLPEEVKNKMITLPYRQFLKSIPSSKNRAQSNISAIY